MGRFVSCLLVACYALSFAQTARLSAEDLKQLTGASWTGKLTYLDYRSNKETSIRSKLTVTEAAEGASSWVFSYEYPDEPKANGKKTIALGEGGTVFGDETVVERAMLADGTLRVVTERRGQDNDKEALFRYTYLIGAKSFSIKKEVKPSGAAEFFERNRYSWER